jgi:hypothetical protein
MVRRASASGASSTTNRVANLTSSSFAVSLPQQLIATQAAIATGFAKSAVVRGTVTAVATPAAGSLDSVES